MVPQKTKKERKGENTENTQMQFGEEAQKRNQKAYRYCAPTLKAWTPKRFRRRTRVVSLNTALESSNSTRDLKN